MSECIINNEDSYNHSVKKQKAMFYFGPDGPANDLMGRFEEGSNCLFYEQPCDIYAYMSLFFKKFVKNPTICFFRTKIILNPYGASGFEFELFCDYFNDVKSLGSYESRYSYNCLDQMNQVVYDVHESIRIIADIAPNLKSVSIFDQSYIDTFLTEFYDNLTKCYEEMMKYCVEEEKNKKSLESGDDTEDANKTKLQKKKSKSASVHSNDGSKEESSSIKQSLESGDCVIRRSDGLMPGFEGKLAISETVCIASASLNGVQPYQYISDLFGISESSRYSIPIPMVTLVGKEESKVKYIKEFLLIPSPCTHLTAFISVLYKLMPEILKSRNSSSNEAPQKSNHTNSGKGAKDKKGGEGGGGGGGGGRGTGNSNSCFVEIENVINLVREALTQIGCELGRDFYIGLTCNPIECFNKDSDSYEVNFGETKSADDLRLMLVDIIIRYPYIVAIIDPFHMQSRGAWCKLCSQVSCKCYIIASDVFEKTPANLFKAEVDENFLSSGLMLPLHASSTLSETWHCFFKYKNSHPLCMLSTTEEDHCSTFIVDLAVALRALFIKLGDIRRVEKTSKYNRLLTIHNQLDCKELLCKEFFQFSQVGPVWFEEKVVEVFNKEEETKESSGTKPAKKESKKNKK